MSEDGKVLPFRSKQMAEAIAYARAAIESAAKGEPVQRPPTEIEPQEQQQQAVAAPWWADR